MSAKNTAFSPNPDFTAQITGSGQLVSAYTATYVPSGTTDVTALLQTTRAILVTTATGNSTIQTTGTYPFGTRVEFQINNDAGGARTITFGTGFRPTGTIVGTSSKVFLIEFISDGLTLNELARSASAIT